MKSFYRRHKKAVIWIGLLLLLAGLIAAGKELSGQANARAQDAGSNSYELEKTSYETIKKPKTAPNCDWKLERDLDKKIRGNDKQYGTLITTAKSDVSKSGKVSSGTSQKVLDLAAEYKSLTDKYSDMWGSCNCVTRSKQAKALGKSREKNAAVLVSEIDQAKLEEMNAAQDELKTARKEYADEAKANDELSKEDKAAIKKTVVPKANDLVKSLSSFVQSVTKLLSEIQQTVQDAKSGGPLGLVKAATSAPKLLTDVQALLTIAQGMLANAEALTVDANNLSE
ncbi:MAG: hypothetical protein H7844_11940 [Nitrospirae bacterium YQR-1]